MIDHHRAARFALPALLAVIYSTLGAVRPLANWLRDAGMLRLLVGLAFVAAAAGATALVLSRREWRTRRIALAMAGIGLTYALVLYPMGTPEERIHFLEYGAVALLAWVAAPPVWSVRRRFVACALFTGAAGWVDELIQALLPSRYYDLRDVGFNALAGVMALTAWLVLRWARRLDVAERRATTGCIVPVASRFASYPPP